MEHDYLKNVGKRIGDVTDLPDELRQQLQSLPDELEDNIIFTLENRYNGCASIDEVLVGLFRDLRIIETRDNVAHKLYKMSKNGRIYSVPKKKGVYSTKQL